MTSNLQFKKVILESGEERQDLATHANPDCTNCGPTDSKTSRDSKTRDSKTRDSKTRNLLMHTNPDCVDSGSSNK